MAQTIWFSNWNFRFSHVTGKYPWTLTLYCFLCFYCEQSWVQDMNLLKRVVALLSRKWISWGKKLKSCLHSLWDSIMLHLTVRWVFNVVLSSCIHQLQWFCYKQLWCVVGLILWNPRSQCRTNESHLKKTPADPKLKMLGPLCDQTVNLKTDVSWNYNIVLLVYSTTKARKNTHR